MNMVFSDMGGADAISALKGIAIAESSQPIVQEVEEAARRAKLSGLVNDRHAEGVAYRAEFMKDREQSIDYFEHHQWPDSPLGTTSASKIEITINRVKPTIETIMGVISRTKMMVAIEGVGPEDAIKGAIFNSQFEMTVRKDGAEFIMHESLKESRKTGLGICKETWDWRMNFPFGLPRLELLRSSEVIIQPGAMGLQYEDANWIIHEKIYDTDELRAMYPEMENEIRPDDEWLGALRDSHPHYITAHTRKDILRLRTSGAVGPSMPANGAMGRNTTTMKEMWYKHYTRQTKHFALRDFPELDLKAGRELPEENVALYGLKNGEDFAEIPFATHQMRVAKVINDKLVSDTPTPYGHDRFPFLYFKANPLDAYTYPASDIIYLVQLQDMLNKIYSLVSDHAIRVHNSPIFIDDNFTTPDLMEKIKKFWSWPGIVIPRRRGAKAEQLQQTPIAEGLLLIARQLSTSLDELAGVHGDRVTQEYGGESGRALEERRMSADIFHQPKSNPIQHGLLHWAEMRVKNIQHLMRQETMVKIDDRLAKILEGSPHKAFMQTDPMGGAYYKANQPGMNEDGQVVNLNDLRNSEFDIKATLVADYAQSKRSKAELALGLGKSQFIQGIDVLRGVDWPDPEGVTKRIDERNELLQMGQKVAEDPVIMALMQDQGVRAEVEAYLKAKIEGGQPPPAQGVPS